MTEQPPEPKAERTRWPIFTVGAVLVGLAILGMLTTAMVAGLGLITDMQFLGRSVLSLIGFGSGYLLMRFSAWTPRQGGTR